MNAKFLYGARFQSPNEEFEFYQPIQNARRFLFGSMSPANFESGQLQGVGNFINDLNATRAITARLASMLAAEPVTQIPRQETSTSRR